MKDKDMKVHFCNGERTKCFFSEFRSQINEPNFPNFVSFQIDINHSFIQASINTECLDIDFKNFLIDLQKLYRMEVKTVSFVQTIEKDIEMNFSLNDLGHIFVRVTIHKQIDSTFLQFLYGIDQSFLPELIDEIETMIKEMEITN
jgi:hypothetical protein